MRNGGGRKPTEQHVPALVETLAILQRRHKRQSDQSSYSADQLQEFCFRISKSGRSARWWCATGESFRSTFPLFPTAASILSTPIAGRQALAQGFDESTRRVHMRMVSKSVCPCSLRCRMGRSNCGSTRASRARVCASIRSFLRQLVLIKLHLPRGGHAALRHHLTLRPQHTIPAGLVSQVHSASAEPCYSSSWPVSFALRVRHPLAALSHPAGDRRSHSLSETRSRSREGDGAVLCFSTSSPAAARTGALGRDRFAWLFGSLAPASSGSSAIRNVCFRPRSWGCSPRATSLCWARAF